MSIARPPPLCEPLEPLEPPHIEIASPGTRKRDQGIKRQLFDRGGVREYWILDPDTNAVRVFRREAGGLQAVAELTANDVLTTPLLPGLEIRLNELFV